MDKKTINSYNQFAEEYDKQTVTFWDEFPRTFFDTFAASVKGKVLDIGSGPGRDGTMLKEKGLEVICLDASEAMIKLSSEKGLDSVLGDFSDLPFVDNKFDGVWAYTALLHVFKSEVGRSLKEIRRVLKPKGIFGLGMIEGETEEYRESLKVGAPRLFSYYKKEEVEELLHDHGFEVVYFETFKPGSRNYLNFIARNNK